MNKYYPGKPVNIHIQSLINIIRITIGYLPLIMVRVKLRLFHGNGKRLNLIYACRSMGKELIFNT